MLHQNIIQKLRLRKEALGMPYEAIAKRSGVGIATIKRAFSGADVSIGKLDQIAMALGLDENLRPTMSAVKMKQMAIEEKAEMILSRVLHTSSLESQTPSPQAQKKMRLSAKCSIAALPVHKVWL